MRWLKRSALLLILCLTQLTFAGDPPSPELVRYLSRYQNILFDTRGSRGGNGDVAAAYLVATELLTRWNFSGKITFLVDEPSTKILSNMSEESPDHFFGGRIRIVDRKVITETDEPFDLYFSLASPSGKIRYQSELRKRGENGTLYSWDEDASEETEIKSRARARTKSDLPKKETLPPMQLTEKPTIVVQTVLGNTENPRAYQPFGLIRHGDHEHFVNAAGFGENEQGIYYDFVADSLRGKSRAEVRQKVVTETANLKNLEKRKLIEWALWLDKMGYADVSLAYGITARSVRAHFLAYLRGAIKHVKKTGKSLIILTPSGFSTSELDDDLEDMVVNYHHTDETTPFAKRKVYLARTGSIPHALFVSLMAYSAVPPVIAGDGSMSAAIRLGIPFVMTQVAWNERNIQNWVTLLKRTAKTDFEKVVYKLVYEKLNLDRFADLMPYRETFQKAAGETHSLTESIIRSVMAIDESDGLALGQVAAADPKTDPQLAKNYFRFNLGNDLGWADSVGARDILTQEFIARPEKVNETITAYLDTSTELMFKHFPTLLESIIAIPDLAARRSAFDHLHRALGANRFINKFDKITRADFDQLIETAVKDYISDLENGFERAAMKGWLFEMLLVTTISIEPTVQSGMQHEQLTNKLKWLEGTFATLAVLSGSSFFLGIDPLIASSGMAGGSSLILASMTWRASLKERHQAKATVKPLHEFFKVLTRELRKRPDLIDDPSLFADTELHQIERIVRVMSDHIDCPALLLKPRAKAPKFSEILSIGLSGTAGIGGAPPADF